MSISRKMRILNGMRILERGEAEDESIKTR